MVNRKFKPVKALQRGLRLIEAISRKKEGAFLKDLAREIDCSSAAAYHLVHTLADGGYVRRLESPVRYTLGDGLLRLQENLRKDRFYGIIHEAMRNLAVQLPGATIYLSEYIGGSVVVCAHVSSAEPMREGGAYVLPPYVSAGSLVHLAFWPPDIQEEYQTRYSFDAYGLHFWGSRHDFEKALHSLRGAGVFLMPEDSSLKLKLAMPVFRSGGSLAAALTIQWNQKERKNLAQKKRQLIALARETGNSITRQLA